MKLDLLPLFRAVFKFSQNRFIILCFALTTLCIETSVAQSPNLTDVYIQLDLDNPTVEQVFEEIEKQTDFIFVHGDLKLNNSQRIRVSGKKISVQDVLSRISEKTGLQFYKVNNNISVSRKEEAEDGGSNIVKKEDNRQAKIVTGTVTSADMNEALPGVNVYINGTTQGTMTDADGKYTIEAPSAESVLVFSFVGYAKEEIVVGEQSVIDVVLTPDIASLQEIVVTALGIEKNLRTLSYQVQEVEAQSVSTVKDVNFVNSLAGKVAGVTINASSAGIGGSTRVVMRGTKSISGSNNALYVIDGMPLPSLSSGQPADVYSGAGQTGDGISNINPDDIESISILSGPAAAALYGSDAANGVVMVTTRKGNKESGFLVNVSNSTMFYSPFVMPKFQNRYGSEIENYYSWGEKLDQPSSYDPKDFFQTGVNVTNSISLSNSTEHNQTYFSASSVNADGIIHNNGLDRYNFSIRNTSTFLDDKLSLDLNMMYIKLKEQNMLAQGQYFNPLVPIYLFPRGDDIRKYQAYQRYDATRNFQTQFWPFGDLGFQMQNPYWITEKNSFINNKDRYLMSAALKYNIAEGISVTGRARIDRNVAVNEKKYYASTAGLFASDAGAYYKYDINTRQIYTDAIVNITKTFGYISFSANAGTSLQDVVYDYSTFGGHLQSVPNLFTFSNINLSQAETAQSGYHDRTQAVFATVQTGYKNMVYLDLTARNDWVSALANTKARSIFYPSIGLSSVLTDVLDMHSNILSFLKARVSYSEVGNAPLRYVSIATYPVINGYPQTSTYLPATGLEPERTRSYEAGLNFVFFDKLKVNVTGYRSSTYNQLFNPSLSSSSGYSSFYVNAGQIDNKGIELSVGYDRTIGPVNWTSNVVYSLNRNKIVQLLPSYTVAQTGETVSLDSLDMGGSTSYKMILVEGGSMGDIYVNTLKRDEHGYIWVNTTTQTVSPDQNRFVHAGNSNPKYVLGFRNSFAYKNFNLSFLINARVGGVGVSVTQAVMDAFGVSEASAIARDNGGAVVNGYKLPAQAYYQTIGGGTAGIGSQYVYSMTNVRLAELSLGYDVPISNYYPWVKGLNVSLIGRNLFMFYNRAPFDPESTANTGTYYQGIDYFMQPSLRSMGFAVKVKF